MDGKRPLLTDFCLHDTNATSPCKFLLQKSFGYCGAVRGYAVVK